MIDPITTGIIVSSLKDIGSLFFTEAIKASGKALGKGITDKFIAPVQTSEEYRKNTKIEESRQQIQLAQMKLSILQQKDDQEFELQLAQLNHEYARKLEEFRQNVNWEINQRNLDFQKWRFEEEKQLQLQILALRQNFDQQLAIFQRETALQSIETKKRSDNSPIWLVASDILHSHTRDGITPLRIFIAPPELDYDRFSNQNQSFRLEAHLSEELRKFLDKNYSFNNEIRPTQLLDGAWASKRFRGGASIHALYTELKSVPILVLESEVDGDYINFRFAYWGLMQSQYIYKTVISRLPFKEILYEFAKSRALKWRETRNQLIKQGMKPDEVDNVEKESAFNLQLLEQEEKLKAGGIDTRELSIYHDYKINKNDFEALCQLLVICHCLITGFVADIYFLTDSTNIPPLLPQLIPDLLNNIPDSRLTEEIIHMVVSGYQSFYEILQAKVPNLIPDLMLQLVQSLTQLPNKSFAKEQMEVVTKLWLKLRGINTLEDIANFESIKLKLDLKNDVKFMNILHQCRTSIEVREKLTYTDYLLAAWFTLINEEKEKMNRLVETMKKNADIISEGFPNIYQLKLKTDKIDNQKKLAKCHIGKPNLVNPAKEKVLMVVGATGAGKTTLINGMVNYIAGVKWEDNFRFQLIADEGGQSQTQSQTKFITAYTLHQTEGSPLPYTLTIIDTPGFGDTGGLKRDKEITDQIRDFFSMNGIDYIDGIGFVTQSSLSRLTSTQQYIFDAILSIFGKNIAENIFIMATFADGKKPPVIQAIEEANVPYTKYFRFNNSALFAENESNDEDDEESFDKMFWKMGIKSFKDFFVAFETVKTQPLEPTRNVLEERKKLEVIIEGILPQINLGLLKLNQLQDEERVLGQHKADMDANKNFTYSTKVPDIKKIDLPSGQHTTTCLRCNYTCHDNCAFSDNNDKRSCYVMTNDHCTVCPGKCHWTEHKNLRYKIVYSEKIETRTFDDILKRYKIAKDGKNVKEQVIQALNNDLRGVCEKLFYDIQQAQQSLKRLDEIALKPNPLTEVQYIELLIESEKQQTKSGWEERVKYLEEAKECARYLSNMKNATDIKKNENIKQWAENLISKLKDGKNRNQQLTQPQFNVEKTPEDNPIEKWTRDMLNNWLNPGN
jgi:hypothetical protein